METIQTTLNTLRSKFSTILPAGGDFGTVDCAAHAAAYYKAPENHVRAFDEANGIHTEYSDDGHIIHQWAERSFFR